MLKLHKFLRQNPEYKIVHAHTLLSNAFHLSAAKGAGIENRISHAHSTSNGQSNTARKIYEKWALITNNRLATQKIACGQQAAEYLFNASEGVWILPNAVDIKKMVTVANQSRDYISKEFKDNDIKVLQIGRLNEVKNHQFSIEIAEELKGQDTDFTIYFVGQGPLENALKEQVKKRGLEDKIVFLGLRTDITELMASADYMIMPSLHEGFPVVLVESQVTALKAIVSDEVSNEVDFNLGLVEFLSLNSVKDWANCLLQSDRPTPNDKEIVEALEQRGFDVTSSAKKLSKFYENCIALNHL